jgi:hypothetical protein
MAAFHLSKRWEPLKMHSAPRIRLVGGALVGAESHWYEAVDHVAWQHGWADAY